MVFGSSLLLIRRVEASSATEDYLAWAINDAAFGFHSGSYIQAGKRAQEAAVVALKTSNLDRLATLVRYEGDVCAERGDFEDALVKYGSALTLKQLNGEFAATASLYEAMGDVKTHQGRLDEAEDDLTKAHDLYLKAKDDVGVSMACRDLGTVWYLRGKYEKAEFFLGLANAALANQIKPDLAMDIKARRALVHAKQGRVGSARADLNAALAHWKRRRHLRWQAVTLQQQGEVELLVHDRPAAKAKLAQSRELFARVGDRFGEHRSLGLASD